MHRKYRPWASSARQLSSVQKNTTCLSFRRLISPNLTFSSFRKNTLRARGESNRVPPGSDPPTSRGPNHYANPALESCLLGGFLCTGNTGPGREIHGSMGSCTPFAPIKGAMERATESGNLTDHLLAARSAGARRDLASRTPVANNNGVELNSLYMDPN